MKHLLLFCGFCLLLMTALTSCSHVDPEAALVEASATTNHSKDDIVGMWVRKNPAMVVGVHESLLFKRDGMCLYRTFNKATPLALSPSETYQDIGSWRYDGNGTWSATLGMTSHMGTLAGETRIRMSGKRLVCFSLRNRTVFTLSE